MYKLDRQKPGSSIPLIEKWLNKIDKKISKVGSIHITTTNENPSKELGGKWVLVDKSLKRVNYSNTPENLFERASDCSSCVTRIIAGEHGLSVTIEAVVSQNLGDVNILLGTIDWEKIGISRIMNTQYSVSASDASDGAVLTALSYTGEFRAYDVFPKSATIIPSGSTVRGVFHCDVNHIHMNDEYCDKFYWECVE